MKKFFILFVLLLANTLNSIEAQENNVIPGKIIVMLNSSEAADKLAQQLTTINSIQTQFKIERVLSESMNIFLCEFNPSFINPNILLNLIKVNPNVKVAQFDHYFKKRSIPDDSLYSSMWNMNNTGANSGIADADIDAPEAWNITTGGLTAQGDTIVVAVIDDGFYINHKDINFWKNYQEIPNDSIDNDGNGYIDDFDGWNAYLKNDNFSSQKHGTHISGIIGAKGNNHIGVTGINWNMKIMPIVYGPLSESNVVASYSYIRDQRKLYNETNGAKGAFIVATNCSFGIDTTPPSAYPLWCGIYDSLGAVGILSVGATANNNYNVDSQGDIPTACPSNFLVTVTNTTYRDEKNSFAAYGLTTIDLGAPGTNILSTLPNNTYGSETGTSMSTPHVAGAIALMYSIPCNQFITNYKANPSQVALIVKDSLLGAVDKISALKSITVSGGRLNLYNSVNAMENYCDLVGIQENEQTLNNDINIKSLFPNPANEKVTIVYENKLEMIELFITNLVGQKVMRTPLNSLTNNNQIKELDVSNIQAGIYFITIESGVNKSNTMKLIIR